MPIDPENTLAPALSHRQARAAYSGVNIVATGENMNFAFGDLLAFVISVTTFTLWWQWVVWLYVMTLVFLLLFFWIHRRNLSIIGFRSKPPVERALKVGDGVRVVGMDCRDMKQHAVFFVQGDNLSVRLELSAVGGPKERQMKVFGSWTEYGTIHEAQVGRVESAVVAQLVTSGRVDETLAATLESIRPGQIGRDGCIKISIWRLPLS